MPFEALVVLDDYLDVGDGAIDIALAVAVQLCHPVRVGGLGVLLGCVYAGEVVAGVGQTFLCQQDAHRLVGGGEILHLGVRRQPCDIGDA